jgi:hypothetical protein
VEASSHRAGPRASVSHQIAFAFHERAGIAEFTGNLSRHEAELIARREVGLEPPLAVSDVTGGPLSGEEAGRAQCGKSLRCAGLEAEDGSRCCRQCLHDALSLGLPHPKELAGFTRVLWRGAASARHCVRCGALVAGEMTEPFRLPEAVRAHLGQIAQHGVNR